MKLADANAVGIRHHAMTCLFRRGGSHWLYVPVTMSDQHVETMCFMCRDRSVDGLHFI